MTTKSYGDSYADLFDLVYGEAAPPPQVAALVDLAGDGPVLELGLGTGRVAVPLAAEGLEVHGVDNSSAMLSVLAAKPGGDAVRAKVGALPEINVDGQFSLVFCVDNTLLLLPSQEQQAQCIQNAASLLAEDGVLVLETFAATAPPGDTGILLAHSGENATVLWAFEADPLSQLFHIREIIIGEDLLRVVPFDGRGVSPAELDLMARLAGLKLRSRWGGWDKEPIGPTSLAVISVYERSDE